MTLEGRTFELRTDNPRARRYRNECAVFGELVVTVLRVVLDGSPDANPGQHYGGGEAQLLVLLETGRYKFGDSISLGELAETELFREVT